MHTTAIAPPFGGVHCVHFDGKVLRIRVAAGEAGSRSRQAALAALRRVLAGSAHVRGAERCVISLQPAAGQPAESIEGKTEHLVLESAYADAEYVVHGVAEPIRVGEPAPQIDALLRRHGMRQWAFITAANPHSVPFSAEQNAERHRELIAAVAGFVTLDGVGRDPRGRWPEEESLLVLGVSRGAAEGIGRLFGQNAFLVGEVGGRAELVWVG